MSSASLVTLHLSDPFLPWEVCQGVQGHMFLLSLLQHLDSHHLKKKKRPSNTVTHVTITEFVQLKTVNLTVQRWLKQPPEYNLRQQKRQPHHVKFTDMMGVFVESTAHLGFLVTKRVLMAGN